MSFAENILYGLVSGIAQFLPVSSRAHQALLRYLFGTETRVPLQELLVHMGVLLAAFLACSEHLFRLRREQRALQNIRRRRQRTIDSRSYYDLRLLKTATVPMMIGLVLTLAAGPLENSLLLLMLFWLLNAGVLLVADHTWQGNRDSRTMSALDGIVMGILGAFSVLPGISRTGMIASYAKVRGASNENIAVWSILLCIPAMILALLLNVVGLFQFGFMIGSFGTFLGYLLSGVAAFAGGYMGISFFKQILNHSGLSGFAYYSIGAGLLSFFLYLIT